MKIRLGVSLILLVLLSFYLTPGLIADIETTLVSTGGREEVSFSGDTTQLFFTGEQEQSLAPLGLIDTPLVSTAIEQTPLLPQLVISEVFFDGTDEWFEITNIGSGQFTGTLTVRGVKSTDVTLPFFDMTPGSVYVWGDTMSQIVDKTIIKGSNLGLSISDTNTLHITLFSSGVILDSIDLDATTVSSLPNNYGFEKIWSGGNLVLVPTSSGTTANISGLWMANPGVVQIWQPPITIINTGQQNTTGVQVTGFTTTGSTMTGIQIFSGSFTGYIPSTLLIQEVHSTNDTLPEYVEIYSPTLFSGIVSLVGGGSATATKTFFASLYTGQHIVISDTLSGFVDTSQIALIDSISLTDTGEPLTLIDSRGNIYDTFVYTGSSIKNSRYKDATGQLFVASPTPGFSEKNLIYVHTSSTDSVGVSSPDLKPDSYYQGLYKKRKDRYYDLKRQIGVLGISVNKSGIAYKKSGDDSIELSDGAEDFDNNTKPPEGTIQIVAILPDVDGKDDNHEQLILQLVSGAHFSLDGVTLHSSKKIPLQGFLEFSGQLKTISGTLGLTNKPTCVILEQGTTVYDTFCYGQPRAGVWIGKTGDISSEQTLSGLSDFSWMKELKFVELTGDVCALFGNTPFSCLSISSLSGFAKSKKYEKKIISLHKKLDTQKNQYISLKEKYKKTKLTQDVKTKKYSQQLKKLRNSYKEKLFQANLTMKIWKNYTTTLHSYLKKSRPIVVQNRSFTILQDLLYRNLTATTLPKNNKISLYEESFSLGDLKNQYLFLTNPEVFLDYTIAKSLRFLFPKIGVKREKWLTIWYNHEK